MRYRFKNFAKLVCVILFLSPVVAQAYSCSKNGYTVVFVNGIFNNKQEAESNEVALSKILKSNLSGETITYKLGYNQTHVGGLGDLIEMSFPAFDQYDLDTILTQMHADVTTRKILLVGHSQGAVYANKIYEYLVTHGVPAEDVAVYAAATPDSYVAGAGKYISYSLDDTIQVLAKQFGMSPLPENVNFLDFLNSPDNTGSGLVQGHSFIDMYLGGFGSRMVADMRSEMTGLKSTAGAATDGCFDPPKLTFAHRVVGSVFAAADPASSGVKTAAVAGFNGTVAAVGGVRNGLAAVGSLFGSVAKAVIPEARTENLPGSHDVVSALYGSSVTEKNLREFGLLEEQGGAVVLAVQKPEEKEAGEVQGVETQKEEEPAVPQEPLIPPPPSFGGGGGYSPGFGGGGGAAPAVATAAAEEPAPAVAEPEPVVEATSTPATSTPAVVSVSSDGTTYSSSDVSPVRIVVTFNTSMATTSVAIQGILQTVGDCGDADAATACVDYPLPAIEPAINYNLTVLAATSTDGLVMPAASVHTFVVDTLGPTVTVNNLFVKTALPAVTGRTVDSSPGMTVQVLINNMLYTVAPAGGEWAAQLLPGQELLEGQSYTAVASSSADLAGNPPGNVASGTVVVDLTAPALDTPGLSEGGSFASTSPVAISFTVSDANLADASCSFDNDLFVACPDSGVFSATLALGAHYFNLIANDSAGNQTAILQNFTVE